MANVTIKYYGPKVEDARDVAPICPVFLPCNSYVDGVGMDGTIYDTNVPGFGSILEGVSAPLMHLPFPGGMKVVNMSIVGTEKKDGGKTYRELSIEVTDYKEVLYFKELAARMIPDFEITVKEGN